MKKLILPGCLLIVLIAVVSVAVLIINADSLKVNATSTYKDEDIEKVGTFTATTAEKLLKKKENTCYSPISMFSFLCFSSEVMEDSAANEVMEALSYSDIGKMEASYDIISEKLFGESVTEVINVANSVWIKEANNPFNDDELINATQKRFNTDIYVDANITENDVNSWISEKTKGMINNVVDQLECFMIVNATYFSDGWLDKFYECEYKEFELVTGEKIETDFMQDISRMRYVKGKDYIAVRKTYSGYTDMIFIKPDSNKKVSDLVDEKTINEILASFSDDSKEDYADVTLRVPKFEYGNEIKGKEISTALSSIGIKSIFLPNSWKKFDNGSLIKIDIYQNNKISVDEKGTSAAGVTVLKPSVQGIIAEKEAVIELNVTLDEPFMYIIVKNGVPLFIGTVYNPTEG